MTAMFLHTFDISYNVADIVTKLSEASQPCESIPFEFLPFVAWTLTGPSPKHNFTSLL